MMEYLLGSAITRTVREAQSERDDRGWVCVSLPLESMEYGFKDVLPFGAEIEVLEPLELRERMRSIVGAMHETYGAPP